MSQPRHHQQQAAAAAAAAAASKKVGNLDAYAEIFKCRTPPPSAEAEQQRRQQSDVTPEPELRRHQQQQHGSKFFAERIVRSSSSSSSSGYNNGVGGDRPSTNFKGGVRTSASASASGSSSGGVAESPHKKSSDEMLPRGSSSSSSGDSPMFEITTRKSGEVSRVSVSSGASLSGEIQPRASCSSSREMLEEFLQGLNDTHQDDYPRYSFELDRSTSDGVTRPGAAGANRAKTEPGGNGNGNSSGGSSSGGSPTPEIFNRGTNRKSLDAAHHHHGSNNSSAGSSDGGGSPTAESLWGGKLNGGMVTGGSFSSFSTVTSDGTSVNHKVAPTVIKTSTLQSNGSLIDAGRLNGATASRFLVGTTPAPRTKNAGVQGFYHRAGPSRGSPDQNPEDVKNAGNAQYKKGNFSEALALYDRAVTLCPDQAAYRCNRAAALAGLGRISEAVKDSEMAIKLDPSFSRAHERLASLHLRLGQVEDARKYMRLAGLPGVATEAQRASTIERKLASCYDAKAARNWSTVVKECDAAIVAGADSAVEVYAMKAEALLKLHRLDDADAVLVAARRLEDASPRAAKDTLLVLRAQIDMAQGRFEEAVAVAERAARLEPRNPEISSLLRKARTVAKSRTAGNDFFKAAKYFEACAAYTEGLELDPANSVLLCNRAASRSKLGQWEKALEDCNAALRLQPNYMKALLRRAQSYAKLERWEAAIRDYEVLRRELPGDVEVAQALFEAQVLFKRSRGEEICKTRFGGVEEVSRNDRFREAISGPGLSVVEFTTRWSDRCRQFSGMVEELSRQYLSVTFSRVDVDDSPYLAQMESIGSVPTFKIYRNGVKARELLGPSLQGLEQAVKQCGV